MRPQIDINEIPDCTIELFNSRAKFITNGEGNL